MLISASRTTINPLLFCRRLEEADIDYENDHLMNLHVPAHREECFLECTMLLTRNPGRSVRGSDTMGRNFYARIEDGQPVVIVSAEDGYTKITAEF